LRPEQRRSEIDCAATDQHSLPERQIAQVLNIALHGVLAVGSAIGVVKQETR